MPIKSFATFKRSNYHFYGNSKFQNLQKFKISKKKKIPISALLVRLATDLEQGMEADVACLVHIDAQSSQDAVVLVRATIRLAGWLFAALLAVVVVIVVVVVVVEGDWRRRVGGVGGGGG